MFRRPSSRRKSEQQELSLNLVPMMDALVTMVSFLLISMGYMAISAIDTPAPLLAPPEEQVKKLEEKKEPPLQLTAHFVTDSKTNEKKILISDWSGSRENHEIGQRPNPNKNNEITYDFEALHKLLIEIKKRHPDDKQLILKPDSDVPYESLVAVMDAARSYEKTDEPPPMKKNDKGVDEPNTDIFPEVIFGNILE